MIGDDDIGVAWGEASQALGQLEPVGADRFSPLGVRLDEHGPEAGVGAVAQQVTRDRGGEDGRKHLVLGRCLDRPVRYFATGVVHVLMIHAYELAIRAAAAANGGGATGRIAVEGTDDTRIGAAMRLSARNKINATVTGVTKGEAIANVTLDANGVRLVASITVEAADELGLSEGKQVIAIVKASDVILAVSD